MPANDSPRQENLKVSSLENVKRHTVAVDRVAGGWQARCSCGWRGDSEELISRASESANEHREISSELG
jgi:hypothetical protein